MVSDAVAAADSVPAAAPSPSSSATAILDKYNQLHRAIDKIRHETSRILLETEETQDAIRKLDAERELLQADAITANREQNIEWNPKADEAMEECDKVQQEHSQSVLEKQRLQQQLNRLKALIEDKRQAFLTQSRIFRAWCHRMKQREQDESQSASFDSPSLENAASQCDFVKSYCYAKQFHRSLEGDIGNKDKTKNQDDSNNMDSWMEDDDDDADDLELQQVKSLVRSRQQALEATRRRLEDIKTKHQSKVDQEHQKLQRQQQLQRQLERIQNDCSQCQTEISELREATVEAQELAKGFQRDILRRTQLQQQHQPQQQQNFPPHSSTLLSTRNQPSSVATMTQPPHNPYAATSSSSASKQKRNNSRTSKKRAHQDGIVPNKNGSSTGANAGTADRLQHPHRAGRIRVDKQFSTSNVLDEIGGAVLTDVIGGFDHHPPAPQHPQQVHDVLSQQSPESTAQVVLGDDDDDPKDDDELLSYVAFSSKKR